MKSACLIRLLKLLVVEVVLVEVERSSELYEIRYDTY